MFTLIFNENAQTNKIHGNQCNLIKTRLNEQFTRKLNIKNKIAEQLCIFKTIFFYKYTRLNLYIANFVMQLTNNTKTKKTKKQSTKQIKCKKHN